jgi:hypothetical protein
VLAKQSHTAPPVTLPILVGSFIVDSILVLLSISIITTTDTTDDTAYNTLTMATATMSLTSPNYFDEREHEGRRSIKSQYSHHLRSSSDSRQQQQPQAGGGQPSSYPNHEIRVVDVTGDDDVFMGGPSSSSAAAPHGAQPGPKLAVPSFAHHSRPSSEERTTTPVGPPPPSPPVSVDRLILADSPTDLTESPQRQPLELWDSHQ